MRVITVQHKNVHKELMKTGVYTADINRVSENLRKPYQAMCKAYRWKNIPIFVAPVGYKVEFSGANFEDEAIALELEIPSSYIKLQKYYDWVDFIYFTELPDEFKDSYDISVIPNVEALGNMVLTNKEFNKEKDTVQGAVPFLMKQWLVDTLTNLSKLDKHNGNGGSYELKSLAAYK